MKGGHRPHPQREAILALLREGIGPSAIARQLGVTKSTVVGISFRNGLNNPLLGATTTMWDRLAALHTRLDAVLPENVGVGRLPNEPRRQA